MNTPLLYGLHGAETLFLTAADVYETYIEPAEDPANRDTSWVIEEWSSHPPTQHLPPADWVLETVVEWIDDDGEVTDCDDWDDAARHPEVVAACQAMLNLMASKVSYRMADQHLRDLTVTWDENGEPLLDGEPMYVARGSEAS
jgi:hypothetical protein